MVLPSDSRFTQSRKRSAYADAVMWNETDDEPAEKTVITSVSPSSAPVAPAASTTAYLIVISGVDLGRRLSLGSGAIEAGRGMGCELSILDESVSRRHARVFWAGSKYRICDLGSTNGTFVNDEPIRERDLEDGDRIRIGPTVLKLVVSNGIEASYHEQIYRLLTLDELTQAYNRRYFHEALSREVSRSQRYARELGLILLDIDHFKALNDAHGHLAGDAMLRELGKVVKQNIRKQDILARVGGEELAIIAPESGGAELVVIADKVRQLVANMVVRFGGASLSTTVSIGGSVLRGRDDTTEALYGRADEALYAAKEAGRNRAMFR